MFDALAVGAEGSAAIKAVHGEIEFAMCLAQFSGHGVGIVEIGEGRRGVLGHGAGVENGLGKRFDLRALAGGGFGPSPALAVRRRAAWMS
jgi:hypothetical protein